MTLKANIFFFPSSCACLLCTGEQVKAWQSRLNSLFFPFFPPENQNEKKKLVACMTLFILNVMSVDNHTDIWGHTVVHDPKLPTYLRKPLGWTSRSTHLLWQRTFTHAWVDEYGEPLWGKTTEGWLKITATFYDDSNESNTVKKPLLSVIFGPNTWMAMMIAWLF